MDQPTVTFVFGSGFDFRAPDEVIQAFEAKFEDQGDICRYDASKRQFTLRCFREASEDTFASFIDVVKNYIEEEENREHDTFEVTKVERLASTQIDYEHDSDGSMSIYDQVNDNAIPAETFDQSTVLIPHETLTRTWTVDRATEYITTIITTDLLHQIGMFTNTSIEMSGLRGKLVIKGEEEVDVERAISKLDTIKSAAILRHADKTTFDFFVDEGEIDYNLHILSLKDAGYRRMRTTLLPASQSTHELLVVVLVKWNATCRVYEKIESKAKTLQSTRDAGRLWKEHIYKGYGGNALETSSSQQSTTSSVANSEDVATPRVASMQSHPLKRWLDTSGDAKSNAFVAQDEDRMLASSHGNGKQGMVQVSAKQASASAYKKTIRIPKGQKIAEDEVSSVVMTSEEQEQPSRLVENTVAIHEHELVPPPIEPPYMPPSSDFPINTQYPVIRADKVDLEINEDLMLEGWNGNIVRPFADLLVLRKASQRPNYIAQLPTTRVNKDLTSTAGQRVYYSSQVRKADDERQVDVLKNQAQRDPPQLGLSYRLADTRGNHQTYKIDISSVAGSERQDLDQQTRKSNECIVMDNRSTVDRSVIEETVQDTSELDSRKVKRTMNQQKSTTSTSRSLGATALFQKIESATIKILELSRHTPGILALKVNIGRVLTAPKGIVQNYRKNPFAASEWSTIFHTRKESGDAQTLFANMLTTSWVDAEFILDLKFLSGRRVFVEEPYKRTVVYELSCRSKDGNDIIVEVDEEAKYKVINSPVEIGSLNWHFPKRLWDARLVVTGTTKIDDKFLGTIKTFAEHFHISSGLKRLELFTQGSSKDLEIQSVKVRRETCHMSTTHPDLVLHLIEVQDLVLQTFFSTSSSTPQYRAFARAPDEMIADGNRLWWEAALSSLTANDVLKENRKLEVGEVARWTAQELLDMGFVKDLFGLTEEVVGRIDNVGFGNQAINFGSTTDTPTAELRSKTVATTTTNEEEFW